MSSEEIKTKTGATHRPYDEAFKRAAVAQWQSGMPAKRVADGLGITTESLRAWRRQLGGADAVSATAAAGKAPAVAPASQELQAEVRRLRAQLQSVTNQGDILSLNQSTGFSRFAAIKLFLAGLHPCHELTYPHRCQRLLLAGAELGQ